ncbi:MAG: hypothetical protein N7Q72_04810, partial [Spiroplasma sp. Tabriz.8]|nr:hypothetical protein [Spiroplasma sp. Tabriz.8]
VVTALLLLQAFISSASSRSKFSDSQFISGLSLSLSLSLSPNPLYLCGSDFVRWSSLHKFNYFL